MGIPKACGLCGIPIDIGARVFSIVEMFLTFLHFKDLYELCAELRYFNGTGSYYCSVTIAIIVRGVFSISLIVQIAAGFLLFFVGYKQKNIIMCWIWIAVSSVTVTFFWILLVTTNSYADSHCTGRSIYVTPTSDTFSWNFLGILELYLYYGMWVVFEYTKSVKNIETMEDLVETVVEAIEPVVQQVVSKMSQKKSRTSQLEDAKA